MPCEPIIKDGKVTHWICSRSRGKPKPPPCYKCGKPATRLCDFRNYGGRRNQMEWAALDTCDKPMCKACANNHGPELDFCDHHNNEFHMNVTKEAERVHRARLERFGLLDEEDDNG